MLKFLAVLAPFIVVVPAGSLPVHGNASLPIIRGGSTRRVFGGEQTIITEFPYLVSLARSGSHTCGGSIISEYWVLTAAHCVQIIGTYTIRAGSTHRAKGGTVHRVVEIISHDEYSLSRSNDIALIRVAEPFKFDSTRQPVTLYAQDEEISEGTRAIVSGWGRGSKNKFIVNYLAVYIISKNKCNEAYSQANGFHAGVICAGHHETGKDACAGDSGGPLTIDGRLAGVVSRGYQDIYGYCTSDKIPGLYAAVGFHRNWIMKHSGV